jgi:hypothetical protein
VKDTSENIKMRLPWQLDEAHKDNGKMEKMVKKF